MALNAYGEVVWSWRPDAGVKFRGNFVRRRWQESPVTGESTKQAVKTIAQGKLGVSGGPVVTTLVCFLHLHTRLRVQRASGFPCALCFLGRMVHAQPGRIAPRDRGTASTNYVVIPAKGGIQYSGDA